MQQKHKNKKQSKSKIPRGFVTERGFGNQKMASEFRRLTFVQVDTNNASGFQSFGCTAATMRSNAVEWSSYAASFTEYRLIRTRLSVVNIIASSSAGGTLVFWTDRSGILTPPTTTAQSFTLAGSVVYPINNTSMHPLVYTGSAADLEEQLFTPVTTNAISYQIGYTINVPTSVSTPVAYTFMEWLVEFRSPQ
jgi:hypothetical protein